MKLEEPPLRKLFKSRKVIKFKENIIKIVTKIPENVLKLILKVLTYLFIGIFFAYTAIRNFVRTHTKLFIFLVLIIIVFFVVLRSYNMVRNAWDTKNDQMYRLEQEQRNLEQEKDRLEQQLKELEEKIQSYNLQKQQEEARMQSVPVNIKDKIVNLPQYIKDLVTNYATKNNVNKDMCKCIIAKESGGDSNAIGDNGDAFGIVQYHLGTFLADRRDASLSQVDLRGDPEASIEAMTYAIARGRGGAWSTFGYCQSIFQ